MNLFFTLKSAQSVLKIKVRKKLVFRGGNKCSQLDYLRSKTKLIRQQSWSSCLQARPRCLVMLSSLSSAANAAQRGDGGGCHRADSSQAQLHCPWWKEGTARVKRCRSHVCNEGVLCCNDCALSLSSATMILQFYDPDFLFEKSVQSDPSAPDWHWWPIISIVHWAVIWWPWCQDHQPQLCVTLPLMMELCLLNIGCTVIAGGWAGPCWLCFTELQVGWGSICSQALSYVTAPPPSPPLHSV